MTAPLRIVLGVTSGIAAYKTPDLVRLLCKRDLEVRVVVTPNATGLVGIEALRTVSGGPVYQDGAPQVHDMDHIRLAQWGQWLLVCPATANTIAKLAHGIADNLLSTIALCFERRLVVAPAMNTAMWENAATRANVALLAERGAIVLPVEQGELACGTTGAGRMLPIETIADFMAGLSAPRALVGKRVLVASGPTEEPIDPVRVITNLSSGRMGAALASAAWSMGADVTVVSGPSVVPLSAGVRRIDVRTASQMQSAMESEFDRCDICIMAAAVSDYRPQHAEDTKIGREERGALTLELVANPDILAGLGARKKKQVLVGFALESQAGLERAGAKLVRKNCDMLILNHVESSLGLATSQAVILTRDKPPETLAGMDKPPLARHILTRIAQRMGIIA
jgi:phosphopantothenoylcysteine decarboxylase / phosphopantothenate---cysteine ligase